MKKIGLLGILRKTIQAQGPQLFPSGLKIRGPQWVRVVRERNRFAAILRHAKAILTRSSPSLSQHAIPVAVSFIIVHEERIFNRILIESTATAHVRRVGH